MDKFTSLFTNPSLFMLLTLILVLGGLIFYFFLSSDNDKYRLYLFFFILYTLVFLFLILIPQEQEFEKMLLILIRVLGGSSAIYLVLLSKTQKEKEICLFSFFLSSLYSYLYLYLYLDKTDKLELIFLIFLLILYITNLLLERKNLLEIQIFFLFLNIFIFRVFFLSLSHEWAMWGWGLFLQLTFLYGLKKSPYLTLFLSNCIVLLLIPLDLDLDWKVLVLAPFSGALAIYFLFRARSGPEHFLTYLSYFFTGLVFCLLFKNSKGAFLFCCLNLFLLLIISGLIKPGPQFLSKLNIFIKKEKVHLFFLFGVVNVLLNLYAPEDYHKSFWLSLVLQVWLISTKQKMFEQSQGDGDGDLPCERANRVQDLRLVRWLFSTTAAFIIIYKKVSSTFLPNLSLFWHINEGIEEIMADHVHQEMTRNLILVYLRLFLLIVIKDVFLSLVSFLNKSKNLMDILGCYERYRPCIAKALS